ncbi:class GN sortase [Alteromonas sp. 5E99-2]|uniref:class GN sortase n=1 Tax=Alteromonas sp. 5E99-2 TaxID=2817683 RepID=UPI001A986284|nr:class GN sortase [Alteromonas sp. 5E99-2]MBO1255456.1 class GN sortase [Alteromonas sp. 5E99-2]
MSHIRLILVVSCFSLSSVFALSGSYIYVKAQVAQYLIQWAWQKTKIEHIRQPPWSWADTYPVAKITIGEQPLYILSGSTGRTLAFGPGHMSSTVLPGEVGNSVISGHRDTHFAILENIEVGDEIRIESEFTQTKFEVTDILVVHQSTMAVTKNSADKMLTLITCYPFNSLKLNPEMRFIVQAKERA